MDATLMEELDGAGELPGAKVAKEVDRTEVAGEQAQPLPLRGVGSLEGGVDVLELGKERGAEMPLGLELGDELLALLGVKEEAVRGGELGEDGAVVDGRLAERGEHQGDFRALGVPGDGEGLLAEQLREGGGVGEGDPAVLGAGLHAGDGGEAELDEGVGERGHGGAEGRAHAVGGEGEGDGAVDEEGVELGMPGGGEQVQVRGQPREAQLLGTQQLRCLRLWQQVLGKGPQQLRDHLRSVRQIRQQLLVAGLQGLGMEEAAEPGLLVVVDELLPHQRLPIHVLPVLLVGRWTGQLRLLGELRKGLDRERAHVRPGPDLQPYSICRGLC